MPLDTPSQPRSSSRATAIAVGLMLLASATLSYLAAIQQSPTFDEPLHATAGYTIRWLNDYTIDAEDPALFPLLSSLLARPGDLHVAPNDPHLTTAHLAHNNQWYLTIYMMFRTPTQDHRSLYSGVDYINRARLVFVAIDVLLGALIALWAYRLAGAPGTLIAAGLFALDPNFLAHGSQIKNDVPISLLLLCMMYACWKLGQRITWIRITSLALACALSVNVKFSGLLFGWIVLLSLLARATLGANWDAFAVGLNSRARRIGVSLALCLVVGLICWLAIWTTYRWRFSLTDDPSIKFNTSGLVDDAKLRLAAAEGLHPNGMTPEQTAAYPLAFTGRAILWLDDHHLFPDAWLHGLFYTWFTSIYRHSFLMGRFSLTGWWYYFPLAMLFKTPLATLALMAILPCRWMLSLAKQRRVRAPSWDFLCLWMPILIYGTAAMRTNLDIGIRHILPLYPFIYILIAVGCARWMIDAPRARWLAIAMVIFSGIESLSQWPHEIPFFNVAAGGPSGGMRLLSDSNLDWGQDLPLLAEWQQQHPGQRLYLAYFGSADPHAYGIDYINIPGGYPFSELPQQSMTSRGILAISATFLQGTYESTAAASVAGFLKGRPPITSLGGSIYIYNWNPDDFTTYLRTHKP